jgi:hypothetical protein
VPESRGPNVTAIGLGLTSHLVAGVSPFIMSATMARLGLIPGMALVYGLGSLGLIASLAEPAWRRLALLETRALLSQPMRLAFVGGLAGFLVAGIAYYIGLAHSPRVAEYIFLTRLDWILQAPVAILVLREPWTRGGVTGGALALAGGVVLAWTGSIGLSGIVAGLIYIVASLAGYAWFTPLSAARGGRGAAALTVWRHWINTLGFLALLGLSGGAQGELDSSALLLAMAGAVVIVALFLLRFTALTGIPLWVLSVQAPVQATVAVGVTFASGGYLPPATIGAILMIVIGELLVSVSQTGVQVSRRSSNA